MWDKQNAPIVRSAFVVPAAQVTSTTCSIAAGDAGVWINNGVLTYRGTDGTDTILGPPTGSGDPALMRGVIPAARVVFSVNPSDGNTLSIGGKTITFKTTLVAATTTTQVKILGSAALTLAAALDAINGVTNINVVKDTTPLALSIVADAVTATVLRIRKATAQGGTAIAGTVATTALLATVSGGAAAWSVGNLNETGKAETDVSVSLAPITISAAMVTNATLQVELPFTPTAFMVYARSSTGVLRSVNEAVTISGNALNVVLAGGASPNFQAGDILTVLAVA